MTLTREQIEAMRDFYQTSMVCSKSAAANEDYPSEFRADATRAAAYASKHVAIIDLALRALDIQWRPIEEAPIDQGPLLLALFDGPELVWLTFGEWRQGEPDEYCGWWDTQNDDKSYATHFIPLSSLPAPEAAT